MLPESCPFLLSGVLGNHLPISEPHFPYLEDRAVVTADVRASHLPLNLESEELSSDPGSSAFICFCFKTEAVGEERSVPRMPLGW